MFAEVAIPGDAVDDLKKENWTANLGKKNFAYNWDRSDQGKSRLNRR